MSNMSAVLKMGAGGRMESGRQEAIAEVQVRTDGGLEQGGRNSLTVDRF